MLSCRSHSTMPQILQAVVPLVEIREGGWLATKWGFSSIAAALLAVMVLAQVVSMAEESQVYDEGYHLLAGYTYLRTGVLTVNTEHPPLAQIIPALPLLALGLSIPVRRPAEKGDEERRQREFVYYNTSSAEDILRWGRLMKISVTVLLGVVIAAWTRKYFGPVPALAALALFAFDPNFIAHGHYITTDVQATLFFLLGCLTWHRFLSTGKTKDAAWCGVVMGGAMATKYSAALLVPVFAVLYLVRWWQQAGGSAPAFRFSIWHLARHMTLVGVVMGLVLYAIFGFETGSLMSPKRLKAPEPLSAKLRKNPTLGGPVRPLILNHPWVARVVDDFATRTPLPMPSFFRGFYNMVNHTVQGHSTYLLGQSSEKGWWYYFPVVAAVKTPTGTLLLLLLALGVSAWSVFRNGLMAGWRRLRELRPEWYLLAIPAAMYFAACMGSHINIGIRHMLPMYPLALMWIAAVLFSRTRKWPRLVPAAAWICVALVGVESAAAFPYYLSFFNAPSGGSARGAKYVVDSNLDWGQDLKRLRSYVTSHALSNICLGYFGIAPPEYYGVVARDVPNSLERARQSGCVVIMSVSLLYQGNLDGQYNWLLKLEPIDTVGRSFRVYDLNRAAPAARQ